MLSLVRAEEKVKCLASDVPRKTQFLFVFPSLLQKFRHLLSLSVVFADIFVIFRHFLRNLLVPGRQKVSGSLLQGSTFSQPCLCFQNMLQLFFYHRHLNCSSLPGFALNASLANLTRSLQSDER